MTTSTVKFLALTTVLLFVAPCAEEGHCQIVIPGYRENSEGNAADELPFNVGPTRSARVQQVYAAAEFGGGNFAAYITAIGFRPDNATGRAFVTTFPSVQIDLSTTSKVPDALSPVFADNVGADDKVVFGLGPLTLHSNGGPCGNGPCGFDIVIPLQHPFFYNPAAGNLLLDIRNFSGGTTTDFDAESRQGGSISSVYSFSADATTGIPVSAGLITAFGVTPVPEASTTILFLAGAGFLVLLIRRRATLNRTRPIRHVDQRNCHDSGRRELSRPLTL
jgi:hypothetical protein